MRNARAALTREVGSDGDRTDYAARLLRLRFALLGALNDVNTIVMAVATVPVALALSPVASRTSGSLATIALAADLIGVVVAAAFSALLVVRVMTFDATLVLITVGNGLIGVWLLMTAALVLAASAVPSALGWLGSRVALAWHSRRWAFRCWAASIS